jgi:enoyl-CoA hydratase/carnithine racemase
MIISYVHLGIAVLNFNRPKTKNALSRALVDSFRMELQTLRYEATLVIIIVIL